MAELTCANILAAFQNSIRQVACTSVSEFPHVVVRCITTAPQKEVIVRCISINAFSKMHRMAT
jgi:hypothetical protein